MAWHTCATTVTLSNGVPLLMENIVQKVVHNGKYFIIELKGGNLVEKLKI